MKGRYWPLVGLGFGACQVVGLFMDDQPPTDGPAKDLATFYAGRFHLELIVAGFLVAAAGIFLALFAGLIRARCQRRPPAVAGGRTLRRLQRLRDDRLGGDPTGRCVHRFDLAGGHADSRGSSLGRLGGGCIRRPECRFHHGRTDRLDAAVDTDLQHRLGTARRA